MNKHMKNNILTAAISIVLLLLIISGVLIFKNYVPKETIRFGSLYDELLCEHIYNVKLRLPQGSKLYIDNEEIKSKSNIKDSADLLFNIGRISCSSHNVKVTCPLALDFDEEIYFQKNFEESTSWLSLEANEEIQQEAKEAVTLAISEFVHCAVSKKDFKDVQIPNNHEGSTLEQDYKAFSNALNLGTKNIGVSIKRTHIKYLDYDLTVYIKENENLKITVFTEIEFILSYDSSPDALRKESYTVPFVLHLSQVNGIFEVFSLECPDLPFKND